MWRNFMVGFKVVIDGFVGSGKLLISKNVVYKLGMIYIDMGVMYWVVIFLVIEN